MNNNTSFPESISHKKLNCLFTKASKNNQAKNEFSEPSSLKSNELDQMLIKWSDISKELLTILNKKELQSIEGKSPRSLIALGAMEAHINMALQALKASEQDQ